LLPARLLLARKLFKVIFPKALEDLTEEPRAAFAETELEFETVLTVLSVAGAAGAVGSVGVEPGFSTGAVGGVGRLAAGKTQVPGFWKISPTPLEPNTGVPV
jgi:hypothetical protein